MKHTAWIVLVLGILVLPAGVAVGGDAGGGNGGAPSQGHRPPPPEVIGKFILAHAQDLNLTDDQKQKVQDWLTAHPGDGSGQAGGGPGQGGGGPGKGGGGAGQGGGGAGQGGGGAGKAGGGGGGPGHGPFANILTPEQHNKLHELLKAEHPQGGQPPAGGGQQKQK
ncbi:MAG: hypothetical protein ABSE73_27325 [Planctomycetota bacterium]